MKNRFLESVFVAIFIMVFFLIFKGVPGTADIWVEYGIKSIGIAFLLFIIEGSFFKKSPRKYPSNE
ncbi:hypothetical protein ADM98_09620 [Exiguobacterium sp. BMC-KP]|uniref:hypothetical protein n=1 Tax=Exiguobacterium sp. BMC-KP TaxID=1684312 RepID=UPI0006AA10BB|nr:hypothetical protein [Exiguobacterium sp. BMC-KP]KOP29153.1 hypothetical protein ADM98_09620 [Exiguobacterium sp. BMC-KP]